MISAQLNNGLCPQACLFTQHHVKGLLPLPPVSASFAPRPPCKISGSLKLTTSGMKCRQGMAVCLFRAEARSGNGNQEPLWKSFGKAIENFGKKTSVEDVLRQQIDKREYYEEGGNPPGGRGGGGGGGGGGFGRLGGSDEEGFSDIIDETIQVIFATLGFIFLYIYIINGAEMTRLAKDYIKFIFGGKKSVRLTRALYQWERFCQQLTEKKEVDRYWLEKAIINTPTWWDHPGKYRRILRAYMQMQSRSYDQDQDEDNNHYYE